MNRMLQPGYQSSKILDIEILRGIAVLFVIIHHSHGNLITQPHRLFDLFYSYFGLAIGVDIFFAISGFVIARQLIPRLSSCETSAQSHAEMINFWIKRFWRLQPSAWLWLIIVLIAAVFFNNSGAFGSVRANYEATIAGFLQVANFRFAEVFGRSEYGASFVYWSLSLEEQFYIVFPFLIFLARRRLPWMLALIACVQLVSSRTLFTLMVRTDALALGALIAWWQGQPSYRSFEPRFMATLWIRWPVLLMILTFIGSLGAASIHVIPHNISLVSLLAAILVFFASYDCGYVSLPKALNKLLAWIGARSYTLYLVHVPAFFATREIFYRLAQSGVIDSSEHWVRMTATFIILAAVAAELNYRYIELPCRGYGAALAKKYRSSSMAPQPL
jgi:peptidoglycan/LPS O-acetylase OafA/YrhL